MFFFLACNEHALIGRNVEIRGLIKQNLKITVERKKTKEKVAFIINRAKKENGGTELQLGGAGNTGVVENNHR